MKYLQSLNLQFFIVLQGRLNELMSQIRLQSQVNGQQNSGTFNLDENAKLEIKQVKLFLNNHI